MYLNKLERFAMFAKSIKDVKKPIFKKKTFSLCFVYCKHGHEYEKNLKRKNQVKY